MLQEMVIEDTQNFDVIGEFNKSTLSPSSYIKVISQKEAISNNSYGKISTTIIKKIDHLNPHISIPPNAEIIDAKVTSYTGSHWTSTVNVNGNTIYNISKFGKNLTKLGDPFMVQIPKGILGTENDIKILSRDISNNKTFTSNNNSIIYTILIDASTQYSSVLEKNEGCRWTIEFDDGTEKILLIPKNYAGTKNCSYTSAKISYDNRDTIDSSAYNLFNNLDLYKNGKIFVNFAESDLEVYMMSIPKVPYMWGPSIMEIRVWDKNR
jgi:putative transposon-encoded protein